MSRQEKETTLPAKDRKRGKTAEEEEEDRKRDRKRKERIAPLSDIKTERKLGQGINACILFTRPVLRIYACHNAYESPKTF